MGGGRGLVRRRAMGMEMWRVTWRVNGGGGSCTEVSGYGIWIGNEWEYGV